MDKRTFFKTPDGVLYSVSERVIEIGHTPVEGVVPATDEEIEAFKQRQETNLVHEEKLAKMEELFNNNIIPEAVFNQLSARYDEQVNARIEQERKEAADKRAAERAERKRLAAEAALEAERQAALEAEKEAALEAERQAVLEAEKEAALKASKPRRFSAA